MRFYPSSVMAIVFPSSYDLLLTFFFFCQLTDLQIWNLKPGWGSRPDIHVEKAHSDDITGLKFSSDGKILLTRSFDDSLKVITWI